MSTRGVPGTGFSNGDSTLKHYFVLPNNWSKYYLKYTFLAFPVLVILGFGTPLVSTTYLKVLSAQELVEEIPTILFVSVIVVHCEGRLVVIGLRTTLSLWWAYYSNLHYICLFLAVFGAPGPWSSSVC